MLPIVNTVVRFREKGQHEWMIGLQRLTSGFSTLPVGEHVARGNICTLDKYICNIIPVILHITHLGLSDNLR